MGKLNSFAIPMAVLALAGCATGAQVAGAPPTASAAPTAKSKALLKSQLAMGGYTRVVIDGQEKFCRNDLATGSHAMTNPVCLTKAQWLAQQERARQFMEDVQRMDSAVPANPYNISGLAR
jgi:hypothetical protein